ncbi:hypothetical protein KQY30_21050 [Streptomyces sp. GMY02]|uniref:hypothetical protein n=1 Tax=Streptomyces sp. GMY02 TaxID=1333528 RepID=UPI001C2C78D1|nr:hypothetical protein [Streptomyces sp. GMY02]QXE36353.1 hypothetical protein KQY30_21050 [Streptomyces sp. GMY02]
MVRNAIGSILALAGAAATVLSVFLAWFDGRQGQDYRVADLFNGITPTSAALATSLLLPFAFAALLTLIALALRSRLLTALAGLIVLGFTALWMVRQGQASGGLSVGGNGSGLDVGLAYALGGGVLLLLAALVMSGRHVRFPAPHTPYAPYTPPAPAPQEEDWGPYGSHPYDPRQQWYGQQDQYGQYSQHEQYGQHDQYGQPYGDGYGYDSPHPPQPPHHGPYEPPYQPPYDQLHDGDTQSLPVQDPRNQDRDDGPPHR